MLRFIDLRGQIFLPDPDGKTDPTDTNFAIYNTVTDHFLEFYGTHSVDCIEDVEQSEQSSDYIRRILRLLPEWVPQRSAPVSRG